MSFLAFFRRFFCIFVYLAVPCIVAVPAALPQVRGAVVQTWHYDPQQKAVVLRLVNGSNKDVTAYSISITVKYADGSTDYTDGRPNSPGGYMEDLLGRFCTLKRTAMVRSPLAQAATLSSLRRKKLPM